MAKAYKNKLRAINNGTRYDVAGKLRKLVREIERGAHGDVRDVIIGIRSMHRGGGVHVEAYHFGTCDIATALYTVEGIKAEIIG